MPDISELIHHYGYIVVLMGSMLEGETVTVLAGIASHKHWLDLPFTILCAFIGGTLGDIIMFLLGKTFGNRLVRRFVKDEKGRVESIRHQIQKHQALAIFGVRFLYGLRIIGPIVIGASDVPIPKFLLFNLLGAAVWSVVFVGGGYLFGKLVTQVMHTVNGYILWIIPIVIVIALVVRWWMNKRKKSETHEE